MLAIIDLALTIFTLILFAEVIISWVAPHSENPAVLLIRRITEPVLAPIRKLLPDMGGIDISPMVVLGLIWVIRRLLL